MDSYHFEDSHFYIFGTFLLCLLSVLYASTEVSYDFLIVQALLVCVFALLTDLLGRKRNRWIFAAGIGLVLIFPWFLSSIALNLLRLRVTKMAKIGAIGGGLMRMFSFSIEMILFGLFGALLAWILYLAVNRYVVTRYDYELESEAKREYSRLVHMLRESNRREVERSARESMLAERNRIARSLHDYIGHTISSAIMQLEAFRALYYSENSEDSESTDSPDRVKAQEHLERVVTTLRSGMVDIRSSIHHLHDESLRLRDRIEELCKGYPQIQSSVQVVDEDEIPYAVKSELLRMVAELVANVAKHSDATAVRIILSRVGRYHTLQVRDNGTRRPARIEKGLGITNLEDFAASHNGSVAYGYQNGFYIHMRFELMGGRS